MHSHNYEEQVTILEGEAEAEIASSASGFVLIHGAGSGEHAAPFCERGHGASRDSMDL
jgi:hypothetical protein